MINLRLQSNSMCFGIWCYIKKNVFLHFLNYFFWREKQLMILIERTYPLIAENCMPSSSRYMDHICLEYLTEENMSWENALKECIEMEGQLVRIKDNDKLSHVADAMQNNFSSSEFWIGIREGKDWRWQNGMNNSLLLKEKHIILLQVSLQK